MHTIHWNEENIFWSLKRVKNYYIQFRFSLGRKFSACKQSNITYNYF